jgi:hypothetical protein
VPTLPFPSFATLPQTPQGMNFMNEDGLSTIPLMLNPLGPMYFWLICLSSVVAFLSYLRFKKKWI